jgi:hypothetical protein
VRVQPGPVTRAERLPESGVPFAEDGEHTSHDLVRGAAFHHTDPDNRSESDQDTDLPRHHAELNRRILNRLDPMIVALRSRERASRGQNSCEHCHHDQRQERMDPSNGDQDDNEGDANREDDERPMNRRVNQCKVHE